MRINPYRLFNGAFIPEWLMTTGTVSSHAKIIYARLCRYAGDDGRCYPKLDELAGEVGLPLSTMRRALEELIEQRMLETVRRGLGLPNDYFFLWHPLMGNPECPTMDNPDCPPVDNQECPPVSTPISRESDKRVRQDITPLSPKSTKAPRRATPIRSLAEFLEPHGGLPPAEWGEWANREFGWGEQRISFEWADFHDYWTSGNAKGGGRKADWFATWRNHCRMFAHNSSRGQSAVRSSPGGNSAGGAGVRQSQTELDARAYNTWQTGARGAGADEGTVGGLPPGLEPAESGERSDAA
jgi:hypothetical protein